MSAGLGAPAALLQLLLLQLIHKLRMLPRHQSTAHICQLNSRAYNSSVVDEVVYQRRRQKESALLLLAPPPVASSFNPLLFITHADCSHEGGGFSPPFVCLFFYARYLKQVSAAADRPARRGASRPPCCTWCRRLV